MDYFLLLVTNFKANQLTERELLLLEDERRCLVVHVEHLLYLCPVDVLQPLVAEGSYNWHSRLEFTDEFGELSDCGAVWQSRFALGHLDEVLVGKRGDHVDIDVLKDHILPLRD